MPSLKIEGGKALLDSATYKDYNIPRLPKDIPSPIRRLLLDVLRRNHRNVSFDSIVNRIHKYAEQTIFSYVTVV